MGSERMYVFRFHLNPFRCGLFFVFCFFFFSPFFETGCAISFTLWFMTEKRRANITFLLFWPTVRGQEVCPAEITHLYRFVPSFFVIYILFLLLSISGSCLQCYSCVFENDAGEFCKSLSSGLGHNAIKNCSANENSCRIDKIVQQDKKITFFKRKCAKAEDCTNKCSDPDGTNGDIICDMCCEENLCNKGEGPTAESGALKIAVMSSCYTIGVFFVWFFL